jgi:hypothetical protein
VAIVAAIVGTAAALLYARAGLTLTHYDARGHLVVARRVIDSLTPGWQQIGAVWLPLPHALNLLPVQVDSLYRSGASAVLLSVAAFAAAVAAIAWIVRRVTGSSSAAAAAAFVFIANPNVLYLQSTPMTEPLLLALMLMAVALLIAWCDRTPELKLGPTTVGRPRHTVVGLAFALACLTRYEAWPVTACAMMAAVWAQARGGRTWADAVRGVLPLAIYPAAAALGFMIFSRIVVGEWLVAGGFFVPENEALGRPAAAAGQLLVGVRTLGGTLTTVIGLVGLLALAARGLALRERAAALVAVAPVAAGALPWLAYFEGHPYRVRYMVPLLAAQAIGVGAAASRWGRATPAAALLLMTVAGVELAPTYGAVPMAVEAQWDVAHAEARQAVTACLERGYDYTTIMSSMGSLGHYMQALSRSGFDLREFLHEGNGDIWLAALDGPRPYAGWLMIEEQAEGGDMLAGRARENPTFLEGFSRVCEGGGVALYRRTSATNVMNDR